MKEEKTGRKHEKEKGRKKKFKIEPRENWKNSKTADYPNC